MESQGPMNAGEAAPVGRGLRARAGNSASLLGRPTHGPVTTRPGEPVLSAARGANMATSGAEPDPLDVALLCVPPSTSERTQSSLAAMSRDAQESGRSATAPAHSIVVPPCVGFVRSAEPCTSASVRDQRRR